MHLPIKLLLIVVTASFIASGCMDLDVDNPNEPDADAALATPSDLESFGGDQYLQWWNGTQKSYPGYTMSVMGQELSSSWGNFGKFDLGRQPREPFVNSQDYDYNNLVETPWSNLYAAVSNSIDVLEAIREDEDFELDTPGAEERLEVFVTFTKGLAYGSLANQFDRAILVDSETETVDEDGIAITLDPPEEPNYKETLDFALEKLSDAQDLIDAYPDMLNIPSRWMLGGPELSPDQLSQLINSYKARFTLMNARRPAERDNLDVTETRDLDWNDIINWVENGYREDLIMEADGSLRWGHHTNLINDPIWFRANYELIGRKDESGEFQDWLDTPLPERAAITLDTPDERIDGEVSYLVNAGAPFHDPARGTYFHSLYQFVRNFESYDAGNVGPMPHMYAAEMDMILAEAMLRTDGDKGAVADLINQTRVEVAGLEPVSDDDSYEELFNAMRYEFELETMGSYGGLAYYHKRGWGNLEGRDYGGLPEGTPLHFPIPALEIEGILEMEPYTFGGVGDEWGAGSESVEARISNAEIERIREAIEAANKMDHVKH